MTTDNNRHAPQTVLYVEDSTADYELLELASRKCGTPFSLRRASDGEQAIAYLSGMGTYADRDEHPVPDLVLLDLIMPRLDGFELLGWIRSNPTTKSLPVVVLAGSSFRADVRRALELGANSYAVKPSRFEELQVLIDQIADVWLAREQIPGEGGRLRLADCVVPMPAGTAVPAVCYRWLPSGATRNCAGSTSITCSLCQLSRMSRA
jgi:CheY-like chemotaxis protein